MLTRWFLLMNLAEDLDRVRRIRALDEGPGPRRGSLHAAIAQLAADGTTAEELHETLAAAEVRLVLTAHPTEARRRTTVDKLARIFALLRELDERRPTRVKQDQLRRQIAAAVQEMWGSDELRAVSTTVLDEVRAGLIYFTSTLADVVPEVYRDLEATIRATYPDHDMPVPPLLSFGSWIGGDRDGNPNVTPGMSAAALRLMKDACLRHHEERIAALAGRVTLSSRVAGEPRRAAALLDGLEERFPDVAAPRRASAAPRSPTGACSSCSPRACARRARARPAATGGPAELLADLRVAEHALREQNASFVAEDALRDVIRQVEVFGFHFALLDVRENSDVHRAAIDEILGELGVQDGYAELPEADRIAVLDARDRRPAAADPARHQRLQRRHARGRRDVPHDLRPAARRAPRHDRLLRHLQHDRPGGPARGAAAHEGGRARARRRRRARSCASCRCSSPARRSPSPPRRSARCSRRRSTAPRWTPSASRR